MLLLRLRPLPNGLWRGDPWFGVWGECGVVAVQHRPSRRDPTAAHLGSFAARIAHHDGQQQRVRVRDSPGARPPLREAAEFRGGPGWPWLAPRPMDTGASKRWLGERAKCRSCRQRAVAKASCAAAGIMNRRYARSGKRASQRLLFSSAAAQLPSTRCGKQTMTNAEAPKSRLSAGHATPRPSCFVACIGDPATRHDKKTVRREPWPARDKREGRPPDRPAPLARVGGKMRKCTCERPEEGRRARRLVEKMP